MNECIFSGQGPDPVVWLQCALVACAIVAFVLRRLAWLRVVCVGLALVCIAAGTMRIEVSPRMAVDRLNREGKEWSEAFRDGSIFTLTYVRSAVQSFLIGGVVLATFALMPRRSRPTKHDKN